MFERYTERARRVLFFARYQASQFGSLAIGTEHILLGLTREGYGLYAQLLLNLNVSTEAIRQLVDQLTALPPGGQAEAIRREIHNKLNVLRKPLG